MPGKLWVREAVLCCVLGLKTMMIVALRSQGRCQWTLCRACVVFAQNGPLLSNSRANKSPHSAGPFVTLVNHLSVHPCE